MGNHLGCPLGFPISKQKTRSRPTTLRSTWLISSLLSDRTLCRVEFELCLVMPRSSTASSHGSTPCKRLKRHYSDGVPPKVQQRLCVGNVVVPFTIEDVAGDAKMVVELNLQTTWLRECLGYTNLNKPCLVIDVRLALDGEMEKQRGPRTKHLWKGSKATELLVLNIRGRALTFLNDRKNIRMLLTFEDDPASGLRTYPDLEWVIGAMYKDLKQGGDEDTQPSDVGDANGDAGGGDGDDDGVGDDDDREGSQPDRESDAEDRRIQEKIKALLKNPPAKVIWAESKCAFIVTIADSGEAQGRRPSGRAERTRVNFGIPRKTRSDPRMFMKWLVATFKCIKLCIDGVTDEDGNFQRPSQEIVDEVKTDDEAE